MGYGCGRAAANAGHLRPGGPSASQLADWSRRRPVHDRLEIRQTIELSSRLDQAKRSPSGELKAPALVVAPTRVNGAPQGHASGAAGAAAANGEIKAVSPPWPDRAAPSATRLSRWISSMNSRLVGLPVDQQATMSRGRSRAGALVMRQRTPSSSAITGPWLVFAEGQGPVRASTWSRASRGLRVAFHGDAEALL